MKKITLFSIILLIILLILLLIIINIGIFSFISDDSGNIIVQNTTTPDNLGIINTQGQDARDLAKFIIDGDDEDEEEEELPKFTVKNATDYFTFRGGGSSHGSRDRDGPTPIPIVNLCGNGIIDSGEQCDDSNQASGDGCSSTCQKEILNFCEARPGSYWINTAGCSNGGGRSIWTDEIKFLTASYSNAFYNITGPEICQLLADNCSMDQLCETRKQLLVFELSLATGRLQDDAMIANSTNTSSSSFSMLGFDYFTTVENVTGVIEDIVLDLNSSELQLNNSIIVIKRIIDFYQYENPEYPICLVRQCYNDSDCDDSLYCNGAEFCDMGRCNFGINIDCSPNNITQIAQCDYIPDNTSITWDYFPGFISTCDENTDSCTQADYNVSINVSHACSISECGAECEVNEDCLETDCDNLDGCIGNDYYDYDDVLNNCLGDCSCENNSCGAPNIFYNDSRCTECQIDENCSNLDADFCEGDIIMHTEGYCIDWVCIAENTTIENCSVNDENVCLDLEYTYNDYTCENAECIIDSQTLIQDCDDSNICTDDSCDPLSGCSNIDNSDPCDDGLFCTTDDICEAGSCQGGPERDCSSNNISPIASCFNNPDNNPFTWDYRDEFISICDEAQDICTIGEESILHNCDITLCEAECEQNTDCESYCDVNVYFFNGVCQDNCSCNFEQWDCDNSDSWYNTTTTQWIPSGECTEQEQMQQEYREYICGSSGCEYNVTNTTWVNTSNTRNIPDGTSCDDSSACTENDQCTAGICDGSPLDCSDGNVCTDDLCNITTGCYYELNSDPCDDGDACTEDDTCAEGSCNGQLIDCNDDNVCTEDLCDSGSGCYYNNLAVACDDGLFCTVEDFCQDGVCQGGASLDCTGNDVLVAECFYDPDAINFTYDYFSFTSTCDEDQDICTNVSVDWEDNITHTCNISECDAECEIDDDCQDYCLGDIYYSNGNCTDSCLCSFDQQDCSSQDGWYNTSTTQWVSTGECTEREEMQQEYREYTCGPSGCEYNVTNTTWIDLNNSRDKADGTSCNDGDLCTENDECSAGICSGTPLDCTSFDDQCNLGVCNASTGNCEAQPTNEGNSCDDSSLCTENDTCTLGTCFGIPKDCSSFNDECNDGTCNPLTGDCYQEPVPDGTGCDDLLYCTVNDQCTSGTCNGISRDCSGNNTNVNECFYDPDAINFTFDYYSFTSVCDEDLDICTETPVDWEDNITHTCNITECDAECEIDDDCEDTCIGDVYYFIGICEDNCTCDYEQEDCNDKDGWYNTSTTQWVDDAECTEKEQMQQEYREYTCGPSGCEYNVTNTTWIDLNNTRNKTDGTSCDDSDLCTENDECTAGVCSGTPKDCSSLDDQCNEGICDIGTGNCTTQPVPDLTPCNDSDICTLNDSCTSGTCSGIPKDCSAYDDQCNDGTCNPITGDCEATPVTDGTPCNDLLFCTVDDECQTGLCIGSSRDCSANDLPAILTCTNDPDNNPFTWDYFIGFISVCDDDLDICTTGTEDLTHTCNITACGAECESVSDCPPKCTATSHKLYLDVSCDACECDYTNYQCVVGECDAECDEDTDCPCSADYCDGTTWVDYPDYGLCGTSGSEGCLCQNETGSGGDCEPTLTPLHPFCLGNCTAFNESFSNNMTFPVGGASNTSISRDYFLYTNITKAVGNLSGAPISFTNEQLVDAVVVTDLSGSMDDDCGPDGIAQPGESPCKIEDAKEADRTFVSLMTGIPGDNVGLVSYSTWTESSINLTDNTTALINEINNYSVSAKTCIECGIQTAIDILNLGSNPYKYIVVMSDGEANRCTFGDCTESVAKQRAIDKAAEAWNTYGIHVFGVAYNGEADPVTMEAIANAGNGTYYYANNSFIVQVYEEIAFLITQVYPSDVYLDVGSNGIFEFNQTGDFTNGVQVSDFSSELNTLISTCDSAPCPGCSFDGGTNTCSIDFEVYSGTAGYVYGDFYVQGCSYG